MKRNWTSSLYIGAKTIPSLRDLIRFFNLGPTLAIGSYRGNLMIYNHKTAKRVPVIGRLFSKLIFIDSIRLINCFALFDLIIYLCLELIEILFDFEFVKLIWWLVGLVINDFWELLDDWLFDLLTEDCWLIDWLSRKAQ